MVCWPRLAAFCHLDSLNLLVRRPRLSVYCMYYLHLCPSWWINRGKYNLRGFVYRYYAGLQNLSAGFDSLTPCQEEQHLNHGEIIYLFVDGKCLLVFKTSKQPIKPQQFVIPKEKHYQKTARKINEIFGEQAFTKYDVVDHLNMSASGAYKFLMVMVANGELTATKGEKNALAYKKKEM